MIILFKEKKIRKVGNAYIMTLPRSWVVSYKLEGTKVSIKMTDDGSLIISPQNIEEVDESEND